MSPWGRNEVTSSPMVGASQTTAIAHRVRWTGLAARARRNRSPAVRGLRLTAPSRTPAPVWSGSWTAVRAHVLGTEPPDVEHHHRDQDGQHDHGHGGAVAVFPGRQRLLVEGERDHPAGRPRAAHGHDVDQVEDLDHVDDQGHGQHRDRDAHHRQNDPPEDLRLGGPVGAGRLHDLDRDALQGGRQDHRGEPDRAPDPDQDQRVVDGRLLAQPRHRPGVGHAEDRVEQADVRVGGVDEQEDHGQGGGRDGHGHEHDRLDERLVADPACQHGDDQAEEQAAADVEDDPEQVVEQRPRRREGRQVEERRVAGEQPDVVVEPDPAGELPQPAPVEAEAQGVDGRVEQEEGEQDDGRAEEHGHRPPLHLLGLAAAAARPAGLGGGRAPRCRRGRGRHATTSPG